MPPPDAPIRELDDLLVVFHEAEKPAAQWRVGTESERIGLVGPAREPLSYEGSSGVATIFDRLIREQGWQPVRERDDDPIVALKRDAGSITLEPGAQMELSGAPYASVAEGQAEWDAHLQEFEAIADELDLAWLGLGCQPVAGVEQLGWVPKLRYAVMREYLPTRGKMALQMMLKTCTVQANLDYASEEDAMRKLRVGLRAQPIVTAMFANSPWSDGADTGYKSYRGLCWLHMDPDRSGLLPFAWKDQPTYRDYVEWALDAPMFLVKQAGTIVYNTGQTFRDFMNHGFGGLKATYGDWETHLATLFPEVRLKNTLEYRGADAQGRALLFALPALWKGLLYDTDSMSRLETLVDPWPYKEVEASRDALVRHGVRTKFLKRDVVDWAGEIVEIAEAGLGRLADQSGDDADRQLLQPLRALLEAERCPADVLLDDVSPERPLLDEIVRLTAL